MLYIIRHGETKMNKAKVLQGRSNLPLNENGIAQAKTAAAYFQNHHIVFDHVFSSPLQRAIQTAAIVSEQAEIKTDDRLLEMDYGPYEGCDLQSPPPKLIEFFSDFVHNPAPAGMEQLSEVVARTGAFIEEIRNLSGNILISTHAIAMKGILEYLTPYSHGSYWSKYIGNCAVYVFDNSSEISEVPNEIKYQ